MRNRFNFFIILILLALLGSKVQAMTTSFDPSKDGFPTTAFSYRQAKTMSKTALEKQGFDIANAWCKGTTHQVAINKPDPNAAYGMSLDHYEYPFFKGASFAGVMPSNEDIDPAEPPIVTTKEAIVGRTDTVETAEVPGTAVVRAVPGTEPIYVQDYPQGQLVGNSLDDNKPQTEQKAVYGSFNIEINTSTMSQGAKFYRIDCEQ